MCNAEPYSNVLLHVYIIAIQVSLAQHCLRAYTIARTIDESTVMTPTTVALPPEQMIVLRTTAPDLIAFPYLLQACYAYGHYQIACGVDPSQLQDPRTFVTEADLERFVDVVSKWPKAVPMRQLQAPTLDSMVSDLRIHPGQEPFTFAQRLDWAHDNILRWMEQNKVDPNNPNETKDERKARLNREAVKRHRQRNAIAKSEDPMEQQLTDAVRTLARSVQAGRSWAKTAEADAKRVRDAAIEAAKAQCVSTISGARAAVANEEHKLTLAQAELDAYKSN